MAEYIERKLILTELACIAALHKDEERDLQIITDIDLLVSKIPAAEVMPVVHGVWVDAAYGFAQCNLCGQCHEVDFVSHSYCPNCGARMDGVIGAEKVLTRAMNIYYSIKHETRNRQAKEMSG